MSAQPEHALTYAEVREWAVFLGIFTASMLADEMGVDAETGRKCVNALCAQGICRPTGDKLDGVHGYEPVVEYAPPPPGPTRREPSAPDPVQQAISQAGRIVVERGNAVRIRTERKNRRGMSTPGQRQKMKNQQREWEKQQLAKAERAAADKAKQSNNPNRKHKK